MGIPHRVALWGDTKNRVIVVAHSQGTIIMGVVLRLLGTVGQGALPPALTKVLPPALTKVLPAAPTKRAPVPLGPEDFALLPDELRRIVEDILDRQEFVPLDRGDFEPLTPEEVDKLEVYCFANCATTMQYVTKNQHGCPVPYIESFGNTEDIVARLGVVAPNPIGVR